MATKASPRAERADESRPTVRFFLADDIRQETNGKVSAIGLYADNTLLALLPKEQADPTPEVPLLISSLGFFVNIVGLKGKFRVSVDYLDNANGKLSKGKESEMEFTEVARSANLVGRFQPFITPGFGTKTIIFHANDYEERFTFEVRRGLLPAEEAPVGRSDTKPPKVAKAIRKPASKAAASRSKKAG